MTDTPSYIKELQLKIWLAKSPMERLKQMMEDNSALNNFWTTSKITDKKIATTKPLQDTHQ